MKQKFYHNTLQSNFIKYILQQNYIPTVPFTSNINHVTKGCTYIHDNYFVKAKRSEDMAQILDDLKSVQPKYKYIDYFERFEPYIFGRRYIGLTTNYVSNTDSYDPETHFYLGQYLKAYKAYYGIDLFPYYNCFSDEYLSGVDLIKKDSMPFIDVVESSNNNYKILCVPISLCQEYTIVVDCPTEILMTPIFLGKKGILKEQTAILRSSLVVAPHQNVHQRDNYIKQSCSFNAPIYYQSPCIPGSLDKAQLALPQYEKYLRLLIRIPAQNNSSIIVMQGHHSNTSEQQDRLINLSMQDVSTYINKISEVDYLPGTHTVNSGDVLNYFGNAASMFKTYPMLLSNYLMIPDNYTLDPDTDTIVLTKFLRVPYITDETNNSLIETWLTPNSFLNLRRKQIFIANDSLVDLTADFNDRIIQIKGDNIQIEVDGENISNIDPNIIPKTGEWSEPLYFQAAQNITLKLLDDQDATISIASTTSSMQIQYDSASNSYVENKLSYGLNDNKIFWYKDSSIETVPEEIGQFTGGDGTLSSNIQVSFNSQKDINIMNSTWIQLKQLLKLADENEYLNDYMHNNLSLIYLNDKISYAYTSRLIEYLVGNVIAKNEKWVKNIANTQEDLILFDNNSLNILKNSIWQPNMRITAFKSANDWREYLGLPNLKDINGFIDKDTEVAIKYNATRIKTNNK